MTLHDECAYRVLRTATAVLFSSLFLFHFIRTRQTTNRNGFDKTPEEENFTQLYVTSRARNRQCFCGRGHDGGHQLPGSVPIPRLTPNFLKSYENNFSLPWIQATHILPRPARPNFCLTITNLCPSLTPRPFLTDDSVPNPWSCPDPWFSPNPLKHPSLPPDSALAISNRTSQSEEKP